MQFEFGFIYKEVRYGWKEKQLYRLPFEKNKRTYGLLIIPQYVFKSTQVYNVQKTKLTINRLKNLTKKVNWNVDIVEHSDLPF